MQRLNTSKVTPRDLWPQTCDVLTETDQSLLSFFVSFHQYLLASVCLQKPIRTALNALIFCLAFPLISPSLLVFFIHFSSVIMETVINFVVFVPCSPWLGHQRDRYRFTWLMMVPESSQHYWIHTPPDVIKTVKKEKKKSFPLSWY